MIKFVVLHITQTCYCYYKPAFGTGSFNAIPGCCTGTGDGYGDGIGGGESFRPPTKGMLI